MSPFDSVSLRVHPDGILEVRLDSNGDLREIEPITARELEELGYETLPISSGNKYQQWCARNSPIKVEIQQ